MNILDRVCGQHCHDSGSPFFIHMMIHMIFLFFSFFDIFILSIKIFTENSEQEPLTQDTSFHLSKNYIIHFYLSMIFYSHLLKKFSDNYMGLQCLWFE